MTTGPSFPWLTKASPEGSLTWNSQSTFVLPIQGSKTAAYMFMGDRWAFPKQASAATYVWQPIALTDSTISIPRYHDAWKINLATGEAIPATLGKTTIDSKPAKTISYSGAWKHQSTDSFTVSRSDQKNARCTIHFNGRQLALYGIAGPDGGYVAISLLNNKVKALLTSTIDTYCKYEIATLKFLTPLLPKDNYTLVITVLGQRGNWSDKKRADYGSTGNFVSLYKLIIDQ